MAPLCASGPGCAAAEAALPAPQIRAGSSCGARYRYRAALMDSSRCRVLTAACAGVDSDAGEHADGPRRQQPAAFQFENHYQDARSREEGWDKLHKRAEKEGATPAPLRTNSGRDSGGFCAAAYPAWPVHEPACSQIACPENVSTRAGPARSSPSSSMTRLVPAALGPRGVCAGVQVPPGWRVVAVKRANPIRASKTYDFVRMPTVLCLSCTALCLGLVGQLSRVHRAAMSPDANLPRLLDRRNHCAFIVTFDAVLLRSHRAEAQLNHPGGGDDEGGSRGVHSGRGRPCGRAGQKR